MINDLYLTDSRIHEDRRARNAAESDAYRKYVEDMIERDRRIKHHEEKAALHNKEYDRLNEEVVYHTGEAASHYEAAKM